MAIIATPVTLSSPRDKASAMPKGTKIITSADIPMVNPKMEKRIRNTGITRYFLFTNIRESLWQRAAIAPVDVIISNAPPIIRINVTVDAASVIPR